MPICTRTWWCVVLVCGKIVKFYYNYVTPVTWRRSFAMQLFFWIETFKNAILAKKKKMYLKCNKKFILKRTFKNKFWKKLNLKLFKKNTKIAQNCMQPSKWVILKGSLCPKAKSELSRNFPLLLTWTKRVFFPERRGVLEKHHRGKTVWSARTMTMKQSRSESTILCVKKRKSALLCEEVKGSWGWKNKNKEKENPIAFHDKWPLPAAAAEPLIGTKSSFLLLRTGRCRRIESAV